MAVILNIDEDHLDFYGNIDNIERAFAEYCALVPQDGCLVGWGEDFRVRRVMENADRPYFTYGRGPENDFHCENLSFDRLGRPQYDFYRKKTFLCRVNLGVAGESNLLDSMAALSVAALRNLDIAAAAEALAHFKGAHRRNEHTGDVDGVMLFTDYGHNPAEIKSALSIAKLAPHRQLWAVWQPHAYFPHQGPVRRLCGNLRRGGSFADRRHLRRPGDRPRRHRTPPCWWSPIRRRGIDAIYTPTFDDAEAYLRAHLAGGGSDAFPTAAAISIY